MSKQPLAASLRSVTIDVDPDEPPAQPADRAQTQADTGPPPRAGKAALTLRIDPELHRDLRKAAFDCDTTTQNLILNSLLEYGFKSAVPDRRIPGRKSR